MSGLFDRLAQRALEANPGISPVKIPVFEFDPAAAEGSSRFASTDAVNEQPGSEPAPPLQENIQGDRGSPPGSDAEPSPVLSLDEGSSIHEPAWHDEGARPDLGALAHAGRMDTRFRAMPREDATVEQTSLAGPGELLSTAYSEQPHEARGRNDAGPDPRETSTSPILRVQPTRMRGPSSSSVAALPARAAAEPAREEGPSTADAAAEARQAPEIHVTIGRVEMRAVPAQSNPRASRKSDRSTPRLTLNDYMRQRSAGRR